MIKATSQGNVQMTEEEIAIHLASQPTEAELLQQAKDRKCDEIDKATREAIVNLIGSEAKQRNLLAKYNDLLEKKIDGAITADEVTIMNEIKSAWILVEQTVIDGNNKEALVQTLETIEQVNAEVV